MDKLPPNATLLFYRGECLDPQGEALLRELGFEPDAAYAGFYYCPAQNWTAALTHVDDFDYAYRHLTNLVEHQLRADGFPVDQTLRLKRLRALRGD